MKPGDSIRADTSHSRFAHAVKRQRHGLVVTVCGARWPFGKVLYNRGKLPPCERCATLLEVQTMRGEA